MIDFRLFKDYFINYYINSQRTHLFLYYDEYLLTVNLTDLRKDTCNGVNERINVVYSEKDNIYVYKVENGNLLKRLLMTPEGELINPVLVKETDFVCYFFSKLVNVVFRKLNMFILIRAQL